MFQKLRGKYRWKAKTDTHPQHIPKNSNISNCFYMFPPVRSLTSADYCTNPLIHNTTLPKARQEFAPKRA